MPDTKPRNLNIDTIRILATLMILTAHITALIFARPDFFGKPFWWLNHIVLSFCRMGTPLFFMMSGYLIGDKKKSLSTSTHRAIFRLGVPFLVFFVVSSVVFGSIHSTPYFPNLLDIFFMGGGNYLYFLVGLFILYLISPLLQKMVESLSQTELKYTLCFLCANSAFYTLGAFLTSSKAELGSPTFLYWFLTLGYFLYGSYLKKYPPKSLQLNDYLLVCSPILVGIFGTYLFQKMYLESSSQIFLQVANYLQSYLGITVMIASLYLFKVLLAMNVWQKTQQKYHSVITYISKNTFGIYLVHMIFLEYFLFRTPLTIDNGPFNPAVMIVLIWLTLTVVSFGTSVLLGVVPILKMAVGNTD